MFYFLRLSVSSLSQLNIILLSILCFSNFVSHYFCYYYVWTFWSKYIKFYMDLDTFIILCRGLLLPEFSSNRLQTLAQ